MSKRTLLACLLLTFALAPADAARAAGPCVSEGDPPDEPPRVATGCGPKIIVRVAVPAAGLDWTMDVGPCQTDCDQTYTIDVIVCSPPRDAPFLHGPHMPIQGEWPTLEGIQEDVLREVDRLVATIDDGPGVVELETFLSCD